MAYRFQVDPRACINCGICMDLCPVRCLDMSRPSGSGELGIDRERRTPVPGVAAAASWMMLAPVQVDSCVGCQVCAQECPTNAITIEGSIPQVAYASRGPLEHLPSEKGWHPLDEYTRATPEEPGESPWGDWHSWHVAERKETWQSWRTWLGERTEDLRAPCQAACPVGTNAGLYVSLVAKGRYDEAQRVASESNPFPSICGRVCTAPCEAQCRRAEFDSPIAIRDLKRFAMDHGKLNSRRVPPSPQQHSERVAIVGAGPTGLSAAYYLGRRGYPVTVYDALPVAGGMMAIGIPDYRLPRDQLANDVDAIIGLGVELRLNTALGRDITLPELREQFDAVLLAVGAQRSQRLDIPGESEWIGVIPATTFLKNFNLEPDTQLEGDVIVVGGGSTAMDAARSAIRCGARSVTVLYRRTRNEMPAQVEEVHAALAEGIKIEELATPIEVLGSSGRVSGVHCQRMVLGEPDADGRRQPVPVEGSVFDVPANVVLVAVGEAPDPSFLPTGTAVGVAPWGGLLINPTTLATGAPGVFAAGDVTYGPASIILAASHGRKAAQQIHAFLQHLSPTETAEMPQGEFETASTLPPDGHVVLDLRPTVRAEMPLHTGLSQGRSTESATGFSEAEAQREASRCLRCDLAYLCPTVITRRAERAAAAQSS